MKLLRDLRSQLLLESAVSNSATISHERKQLEAQLQAFGQGRTRLANDLARLRARSEGLELANREVSKRLELTATALRSILGSQEA